MKTRFLGEQFPRGPAFSTRSLIFWRVGGEVAYCGDLDRVGGGVVVLGGYVGGVEEVKEAVSKLTG